MEMFWWTNAFDFGWDTVAIEKFSTVHEFFNRFFFCFDRIRYLRKYFFVILKDSQAGVKIMEMKMSNGLLKI